MRKKNYKGRCEKQRQISKDVSKDCLQAEIQLAHSIETVASMAKKSGKVSIKGIRDNRQKEQKKQLLLKKERNIITE